MGDLVVMSRSNTPPATRDFLAGHSAEILFFTGVRYYRMDEAADAAATAKLAASRSKSKRLRAQRTARRVSERQRREAQA